MNTSLTKTKGVANYCRIDFHFPWAYSGIASLFVECKVNDNHTHIIWLWVMNVIGICYCIFVSSGNHSPGHSHLVDTSTHCDCIHQLLLTASLVHNKLLVDGSSQLMHSMGCHRTLHFFPYQECMLLKYITLLKVRQDILYRLCASLEDTRHCIKVGNTASTKSRNFSHE